MSLGHQHGGSFWERGHTYAQILAGELTAPTLINKPLTRSRGHPGIIYAFGRRLLPGYPLAPHSPHLVTFVEKQRLERGMVEWRVHGKGEECKDKCYGVWALIPDTRAIAK